MHLALGSTSQSTNVRFNLRYLWRYKKKNAMRSNSILEHECIVANIITLTLKMSTTQVVETSVTVNNNNSPIQDYVHPDYQTQPTFEMTPGFKPFTI